MNRVAAIAPEITWHRVTFLTRRVFDALHLSTQESLSCTIQSSFLQSHTLPVFTVLFICCFLFYPGKYWSNWFLQRKIKFPILDLKKRVHLTMCLQPPAKTVALLNPPHCWKEAKKQQQKNNHDGSQVVIRKEKKKRVE